MGQKRNKTGTDFEKQICESNGFTHKAVKPKIIWSGIGRTNFDKIKNINFDPSLFKPDMSRSKFDKYDAIDSNGDPIEIKKYYKSQVTNWTMLSEPIFKIASRSTVNRVTRLFGDGDFEKSKVVYNNFLKEMTSTVGIDILNKITNSFTGVQFIDGFVPNDKLEFRWQIRESWMGYNRLSIEFKLK